MDDSSGGDRGTAVFLGLLALLDEIRLHHNRVKSLVSCNLKFLCTCIPCLCISFEVVTVWHGLFNLLALWGA